MDRAINTYRWDCGSVLFDSFELVAMAKHLKLDDYICTSREDRMNEITGQDVTSGASAIDARVKNSSPDLFDAFELIVTVKKLEENDLGLASASLMPANHSAAMSSNAYLQEKSSPPSPSLSLFSAGFERLPLLRGKPECFRQRLHCAVCVC